MSKNKKEVVEEVVEEVATSSNKDETSVAWQGGVRTYTKELHGSDHAKLAKEFAAKKNGTIV